MIIVWQFQLACTPDIERMLPLVVFSASRAGRTIWTTLRWPNTHSETVNEMINGGNLWLHFN